MKIIVGIAATTDGVSQALQILFFQLPLKQLQLFIKGGRVLPSCYLFVGGGPTQSTTTQGNGTFRRRELPGFPASANNAPFFPNIANSFC
jgi:hypothetical protein